MTMSTLFGEQQRDSRVSDIGAKLVLNKAYNGDAESMLSVALSYAQGKKGFPKDFPEAIKWFSRSAELGNAYAQNFLASAYSKGEGVPQDKKLAFEWWSRASELGYPEAMYNLAICYSKGMGTKLNYKEKL